MYICRELETYAPHSEQPKLNRSKDELTEGERAVYTAFIDKEYVQKLVDFFALEENKNKDKFSQKKMTLFKVILLSQFSFKS